MFSAKDTTPTPLLTDQLGERWETSVIMVKSYAVMGGLHGAVEAARQLRIGCRRGYLEDRHHRRETVYKHGWWGPERPLTAIGAQMNIGYATAATLLDGRAARTIHPRAAGRRRHLVVLDVTDVHLDESSPTLPMTERFRTDLAVTTRDGTCIRSASSRRTARRGIP